MAQTLPDVDHPEQFRLAHGRVRTGQAAFGRPPAQGGRGVEELSVVTGDVVVRFHGVRFASATARR